jgi:cardiolipin synthase
MSILGLLYLLSRVIAIGAIIHVLLDNRQPAKTMAWALVIYFLPYVGVIAYILFGINRRKEKFVSQRSMDMLTRRSMLEFVDQRQLELPGDYKAVIDLFAKQEFALPFINSRTDILISGYEFFPRLLHDIAQARSHIHIDMYIFEDDALGQLVADALTAKARQGVEVRVIYDGVGCWQVKGSFYERLRSEGIDVEPFMPVHFPQFTSKANYRNHRKIIVIDGRVGYTGGMNIALRYVKGTKSGIWRDTMVRMEGGGVNGLQQAFLLDWYFVDRTLLSDRKYYTTPDTDGALVQTVTSGPVSTYPDIMLGYQRIIMAAKHYVYIETPYFLPTEPVFLAMKSAAAAGVDVRVLVPECCDARFVEWSSRSFLREAVEAGIHIGLYKPGFLHSKLMVSDDAVCTCGSTNLDFRSFENNFEANAFFYSKSLAEDMRDVFLNDERESVSLASLHSHMHPGLWRRIFDSLTRLLSPLL